MTLFARSTWVADRAICGILACLIACTGFIPMTATAAPLVPIVSFLNHWDHHWYVWLPGDPVYEAVEVMANERGPQEPLVWVFFTERAQPKQQLNYYNDQAAVAVSKARGGDAHLAAMRFAMSGSEGAPRGVAVTFENENGHAVKIDVGMDTEAKLSTRGGGLTDQIGADQYAPGTHLSGHRTQLCR